MSSVSALTIYYSWKADVLSLRCSLKQRVFAGTNLQNVRSLPEGQSLLETQKLCTCTSRLPPLRVRRHRPNRLQRDSDLRYPGIQGRPQSGVLIFLRLKLCLQIGLLA